MSILQPDGQMAYLTSDMFFGTVSVLFRYKVQTDMGGDGMGALKKDTYFLHTELTDAD